MDVSAIIAEFGAYYLSNGQNLARLKTLLYRKSQTEQILTTVVSDDTVWQAVKAVISNIMQPFQKAWTPKGLLAFTPLGIKNFNIKADLAEYPDELEASWLGFLADSDLDRKTWPFVRWWVEMMILPKMEEENEEQVIFGGKRKEPTPGTAGQVYESYDGIRTIMNAAILSGRTAPIVTGAAPSDPVDYVTWVEAWADKLPTKYWNEAFQLNISLENERKYIRGYEKKYNTNYKQGDPSTVHSTNIRPRGLASMAGSDKMWVTPAGNGIIMRKKSQNEKIMRVENVDRLVKVFTDFWKGVGFILPELVFTNDVDLGAPSITNITPLTAGTAGGTAFTITGKDFTGTTFVKLGGTNCTSVVVVNDRTITAVTPAKGAGSSTVAITNAFGTSDASTQSIVVS